RHRTDGHPAPRRGWAGDHPQDPLRSADGGGHRRRAHRPRHGRGPGEDPRRRLRRLHSQARRSARPTRGGYPLPAAGAAEDRVMSEQSGRPNNKAGEPPPTAANKATRSYPAILQLNQELFKNLQGLIDEDEARKKELLDTKNAYEMAQAEIARLEREL